MPVYVHELDAERARGEVKKPMSGWGPVKLRPLAGFLLYSARRGGLRAPFLTDVVTCVDGDTLDVPGSPRVVHLPGHTPGSVALYVPSVDAVFVRYAWSALIGVTSKAPDTWAMRSQPETS